MGVRELRGFLDFLPRGVRLAVGDVLGDRRVEEERVLQHQADARAHRGDREVAHVAAVAQDRAALRVEEAHEQAHERGLAAAGGADDGEAFARPQRKVQFAEDALFAVGERDVPEFERFERAFDRHGARRVVHGHGRVEDLEDAVRGAAALLDLHRDAAELLDRLVERPDAAGEDDALLDRHPVDHRVDEHDQAADAADRVRDRFVEGLCLRGSDHLPEEAAAQVPEALFLALLLAERLHDRHAVQRLLHHGSEVRQAALRVAPDPAQVASDEDDRHGDDRERDDREDGELPFEQQHVGEHHDELGRVADRVHDHVRDGALQQLRVRDDARNHVARARRIVERDRQFLQVPEHRHPQVHHDALPHPAQIIRAHELAERIDGDDEQHHDADREQALHAGLRELLVLVRVEHLARDRMGHAVDEAPPRLRRGGALGLMVRWSDGLMVRVLRGLRVRFNRLRVGIVGAAVPPRRNGGGLRPLLRVRVVVDQEREQVLRDEEDRDERTAADDRRDAAEGDAPRVGAGVAEDAPEGPQVVLPQLALRLAAVAVVVAHVVSFPGARTTSPRGARARGASAASRAPAGSLPSRPPA